ncbi:aspartyl-phosphate phosphatase Spo0E family protein [Lentibacillus juripiscarius]|uniref:Aspartyl-phosphate phosphatase Spo0E family protein n=1 Tax=Lentibacillus juripiscarius TaxID=257446 RepID=A0ABW5V8G3_9BACI
MPALQMAISKKRKEMIELGEMYGLTDKRTINCSQQLDTLLNIDKSRTQYFFDEGSFKKYILTKKKEEHIGA